MKKLLLIAAISTALSPAAFAGQDAAPKAPKKSLDAIYSSWSLNDQQRAQIKAANQQFHQNMHELQESKTATSDADHKAMKKLVDEHHKALAKVLNDEQVKVLEAYDRMHQPMRAKGELMRALFASWHLSDDQQKALHDARESMRNDLDKLKSQKFDSREDKRAAFDKIKQDQQARMAKILDPQQLNVLEKMRHVELRGPMGRPPVDGMKALIASWHLDQSKQQALDNANKAFFQQLHELRGPQSDASKPQDKQAKDKHRDEFKAAFEQHRKALEKILTPTQLAALDAFRPAPHGPGRMGDHGPMPGHGPMGKHAPMGDHGPMGDGPDDNDEPPLPGDE
ncbi:hypothetical protein [Phytohalomonas tamaricis]|uniref:hypothetical protein n=1 Tax=Phytohalomonas tamaricis TaxID=2081032 RepID=UPI000D0B2398|nr:hypothetical protein [Phytohalomonas tamaricis]